MPLSKQFIDRVERPLIIDRTQEKCERRSDEHFKCNDNYIICLRTLNS